MTMLELHAWPGHWQLPSIDPASLGEYKLRTGKYVLMKIHSGGRSTPAGRSGRMDSGRVYRLGPLSRW
jgi:hypothetical protein